MSRRFVLGAVSVFSLILLVFAIIAGVVLARVFKEAAARNKNRPGSGDDEGFDTMSDDERARRARRQMVLLLGGAAALFRMLSGIVGGVVGLTDSAMSTTVPSTSVGMMLGGVVGYSVGARRLGSVAAVLSAGALIFGIAASQGLVPGQERTDHNLPAYEPSAQDPSGTAR